MDRITGVSEEVFMLPWEQSCEDQDLVTVVVPAHNAEQFLKENVESIAGQSYRKLEIIYVCDGCTDNTVQILQKYAENDDRIVVHIEEKNRGAGISRNIGMDMAMGDWIIFFDADDLIEPDMIGKMLETAVAANADMCCCYLEWFDDVPDKNARVENGIMKRYCKTYPVIVPEKEAGHILQIMHTTLCTKLIHKSIYKKDEVYAQDIPNANDLYCSAVAVLNSAKIVYSDRVFYHYRSKRNRRTISTDRRSVRDYTLEAYDKVYEYVRDRKNCKDILKSLYNDVFFCMGAYVNNASYASMFYDMQEIYLKKWGIDKWEIMENLSCTSRVAYKNLLSGEKEMDWQSWVLKAKIEFVRKLSLRGCSIWGAGVEGRKILKEILYADIEIEHVFDSARDKWGTKVCGYPVENFEDVPADNIIVTCPQYYYEIKGQIGNRASNVYDLEQEIWIVPSCT